MLYYLMLALRSLRRNVVLTILMVAAVGVGIGTSMAVYTVLSTLSRDPIPARSSQLFVPQIDNWGPEAGIQAERLQDSLSYRDAMALMSVGGATRRTALYGLEMSIGSRMASQGAFSADGHAVHRDFFGMFDVPFREGQPWDAADEQARANVVVVGAKLADRLFPHQSAVGKTVEIDEREYRVVGVLRPWAPIPRFYDPDVVMGFDEEGVFVPFPTAIERRIAYQRSTCYDPQGTIASGWEGLLSSECIWLRFWVELPTAAAVRSYREHLHNYAAEQQRLGRFRWAPRVALKNVREWLVFQQVVPNELRISSLVAFGFLGVCLINSVGLMLARFSSRAGELSIRRAVGASKADIFAQCLMEAVVLGGMGGVLGLSLTALGLYMARALLSGFGIGLSGVDGTDVAAQLTRLDSTLVAMTLALAFVATVCASLYPAWRASRAQPASLLKAQ